MSKNNVPRLAEGMAVTIRQREGAGVVLSDAVLQQRGSGLRLIGTYEASGEGWAEVRAAIYGAEGRLIEIIDVYIDDSEGFGTFEETLRDLDTDLITRIDILVQGR